MTDPLARCSAEEPVPVSDDQLVGVDWFIDPPTELVDINPSMKGELPCQD